MPRLAWKQAMSRNHADLDGNAPYAEGRPARHARTDGSTSHSLLAQLKADEADAWNRLVTLYAPLVYHWCRKLGLAERDVADVLQDVFQSVATHIGGFRRDRPGDTFRGWLRTITRHKVSDHFRRRGCEPAAVGGTASYHRLAQLPAESGLDEAADEGPADEIAEGAADRQLLHRALDLIRPEFAERTWQAFWRVVVDGLSPHDAGVELSMRPGAVRVAKSRVLHRLREELGD
jgi:RNA polymerase sigma-70 factor (ECF subfamily)